MTYTAKMMASDCMARLASADNSAYTKSGKHDPEVAKFAASEDGLALCDLVCVSCLGEAKTLPPVANNATRQEKRQYRRAIRQQESAMRSNALHKVADENGMPGWKLTLYLTAGVLCLAILGPFGVIMLAAEAVVVYFFEEWMANNAKVKMAMGAA